MSEKVNLYIANDLTQANKICTWLDEQLDNWGTKPVLIPASAPTKFKGKYFIKLPYRSRHSKIWGKIKNKVNNMDKYSVDNLMRVDRDLIRKHLEYDKPI